MVGLQGITANGAGIGAGGDEYLDWAVSLYARAWKYSGDPHYLDVTRILLHNTKAKMATAKDTFDFVGPGWEQEGWNADPELADIPVVMLTVVDDKNLGYTLGAAEYLTKPIDRTLLARVLLRFRVKASTTALVVEDDAISKEMVRRMLESAGWIVVEAHNGREALQRLADSQPGIVLLDLMMPEMDGFEFLSEMHAHKEWSSIPVIVVTAKDRKRQGKPIYELSRSDAEVEG